MFDDGHHEESDHESPEFVCCNTCGIVFAITVHFFVECDCQETSSYELSYQCYDSYWDMCPLCNERRMVTGVNLNYGV